MDGVVFLAAAIAASIPCSRNTADVYSVSRRRYLLFLVLNANACASSMGGRSSLAGGKALAESHVHRHRTIGSKAMR